jgi:hypothetical protein
MHAALGGSSAKSCSRFSAALPMPKGLVSSMSASVRSSPREVRNTLIQPPSRNSAPAPAGSAMARCSARQRRTSPRIASAVDIRAFGEEARK